MLNIRMIAYFLFAGLASQGLLVFDQEAGTVTFKIEDISMIVTGVLGYIGTFGTSRIAKKNGGAT